MYVYIVIFLLTFLVLWWRGSRERFTYPMKYSKYGDTVPVMVNGHEFDMLLDTGSQIPIANTPHLPSFPQKVLGSKVLSTGRTSYASMHDVDLYWIYWDEHPDIVVAVTDNFTKKFSDLQGIMGIRPGNGSMLDYMNVSTVNLLFSKKTMNFGGDPPTGNIIATYKPSTRKLKSQSNWNEWLSTEQIDLRLSGSDIDLHLFTRDGYLYWNNKKTRHHNTVFYFDTGATPPLLAITTNNWGVIGGKKKYLVNKVSLGGVERGMKESYVIVPTFDEIQKANNLVFSIGFPVIREYDWSYSIENDKVVLITQYS